MSQLTQINRKSIYFLEIYFKKYLYIFYTYATDDCVIYKNNLNSLTKLTLPAQFKMKYLLIAILLLGACSAQYFNQDDVEASFENDLGDLDTMTKDMDFDNEDDFLEDAQDEEDPMDFEDDMEEEFNDDEDSEEPESDLLEADEAEEDNSDAELGEVEDDENAPSAYVRISF